MKKVFKIGCLGFIGIFLLMAIVGILAGGSDDSATPVAVTDTAADAPEAKKEDKKEEAPPASTGLGQEVEVGDVFFTAHGTSTAQNIGGEYGVNAQSMFLIVEVTVRNEKDEALMVDSSFFKLMSGERTYDSDGGAGIYANEDTNFFLDKINPGVSVTGNVVFDIPADLADPKLQVQTGFFGTETGVITLK